MHQMTLPRLIHHTADPNNTGVPDGAEDDGDGDGVVSAEAAGAARTSKGKAIAVTAAVLNIFLDILHPSIKC